MKNVCVMLYIKNIFLKKKQLNFISIPNLSVFQLRFVSDSLCMCILTGLQISVCIQSVYFSIKHYDVPILSNRLVEAIQNNGHIIGVDAEEKK